MLLLVATVLMQGCASIDEESVASKVNEKSWSASVLAAKDTIGSLDEQTRAVFYGGNGRRYYTLWDQGDVVQVYKDGGTDPVGPMTPQSYGTLTATLSGSLTGSFSAEEPLRLYLPSRDMDFTGQDGTIYNLSSRYSYQEASATVTAATDNILTLSNVNMTHKPVYIRFQLTDASTGERLHPEQLVIHAANGKLVQKKPYSGETTYGDITVSPTEEEGEFPGELFVALLDDGNASDTYTLTATMGSDVYVGPVDKAFSMNLSANAGKLGRIARTMKKLSANTLTLSATEAEVTAGSTAEVTVSENAGGGALTVTSSDESIATVSVEGNTITITGVAEGTATITIQSAATDDYAPATKTISVTVSAAPSIPEGAINGVFTINANGDKVYFSKGNLQLVGENTWQFAENQWDYFGESQSDNHRDLFGWGTGTNPNQTSTSNSSYGSFTDWGNNAISNGGNTANSGWRTLTSDEWKYLFNTRTVNGGTGSGKSYTLGQKVNNVTGVVIYPDGYAGSVYSGSNWSAFESTGCVFLPAAGNRIGTSVNEVGSWGCYWSSTADGTNYAHYARDSGYLTPAGSMDRRDGYSVRLVRPVE